MFQILNKIKKIEVGEKMPLWLLISNAVLVLAIIWIVFLIYHKINKPEIKETEIVTETVDSTLFQSMTPLSAKAAFVFDVEKNKILFKKNEDSQLPLASITKLMTAITAMDFIPENSKVTIRPEFLQEVGDNGLIADESWSMRDLLDFSLVVSSNDGARAIASVIGSFILETEDFDVGRKEFIEKMNQKAIDLGLSNMYFVNETGLDMSNSQAGGYGTAEEVAKLLIYIMNNRPEILEATRYPSATLQSSLSSHTVANTNYETGYVPGLLASKTGYTNLAGGNLVVAFDAAIGRPIVVVVLGSTREDRFTDVKRLIDTTFEYLATE